MHGETLKHSVLLLTLEFRPRNFWNLAVKVASYFRVCGIVLYTLHFMAWSFNDFPPLFIAFVCGHEFLNQSPSSVTNLQRGTLFNTLRTSKTRTVCAFKAKVHKMHPYTLEELRKDIRPRFQPFWGKNSLQLTTSLSAVVPSSFYQDGNIFSICCSYGRFLLDFLKVITTATIRLAAFTDRYPSRQPAFDPLAAEGAATASRSSRKSSAW